MRHKRSRFEKNWWVADHRGAPGWLIVAAAAFLVGCAAMVATHPSASAHARSLHPVSDEAWSVSAITTVPATATATATATGDPIPAFAA